MRAGASVDAADKEGQTCIMLTVQKNSPKLLDMLIRRSAAVNLAPSRDRATALHIAASAGHEECIQLLLKAGSQVGAEDVIGNTPLLEACRSGHMGALNLILQAGGKCNTGTGLLSFSNCVLGARLLWNDQTAACSSSLPLWSRL